MEPNFSGYVSKANLQCADGRRIMPGAFKHQSGTKVPLVYQHNHDDINQVLGHVILEDREDGTWGDAFLNETGTAVNAKMMVEHGDIDKFSIWAKNLVERGMDVQSGDIQEVSLVLAGANPGANVANVLAHSGIDDDDDLLIVGFELKHDVLTPPAPTDNKTTDATPPAASTENTIEDILNSLSEEQVTAVNSVIEGLVTEGVTQALLEEPKNDVQHDNIDSSKKGPNNMSRNVFDQSKQDNPAPQIKHSDMTAVINRARDGKADSLRDLIRSDAGQELMHAGTYGVDNIEVLFPDAQALMRTPTFVDRRQDWVKAFMNGTSKSPFSRVKTMYADITAEEARAKGYIKGHQKTEEVFPIFKRTTGPAMVYKKQKLDRQDIIDVTDFDVVAWMKVEMRGKLDEELARAALLGDGRAVDHPDKIAEPTGTSGDGIRSIVADDDLYSVTYDVPFPATPVTSDWNNLVDRVIEAREDYMGSGNLTAFITYRTAAKLLTIRDQFGHRQYKNLSEVAGEMDVQQIVRVPTELFDANLLAVVVDLSDYNFGANRGGEVTLFDDFDIDFNQYKYLIETYLSGALTLPYAAQLFKKVASTVSSIKPTRPSVSNNVVTIPNQTGVVYKRTDTHATLAAGSTLTLDATNLKTVQIEATPASGYSFGDNNDQRDSWTYTFKA